jgi:hypothetical protein
MKFQNETPITAKNYQNSAASLFMKFTLTAR